MFDTIPIVSSDFHLNWSYILKPFLSISSIQFQLCLPISISIGACWREYVNKFYVHVGIHSNCPNHLILWTSHSSLKSLESRLIMSRTNAFSYSHGYRAGPDNYHLRTFNRLFYHYFWIIHMIYEYFFEENPLAV